MASAVIFLAGCRVQLVVLQRQLFGIQIMRPKKRQARFSQLSRTTVQFRTVVQQYAQGTLRCMMLRACRTSPPVSLRMHPLVAQQPYEIQLASSCGRCCSSDNRHRGNFVLMLCSAHFFGQFPSLSLPLSNPNVANVVIYKYIFRKSNARRQSCTFVLFGFI